MSFITLLTDFGIRDGAVGLMKGVIWRIDPQANIADLSHTVGAQDINEAAIVLRFAAPYFPDGTVHIVVVDPGVGTKRRPVAARFGRYFFVGPDNGVCTPLLELAESEGGPVEIVHLDKPEFWLPDVSQVFHGRDIFSPCGAHLAAGVPLDKLGTAIDDIVRLEFPQPQPAGDGLSGEVIFIDDFGNLQTNFLEKHLVPLGEVSVAVCHVEIQGLVLTFGERPSGTIIAHYGTEHDLWISVVNGDAAATLGAKVGDAVTVKSLEK